MVTLALIFLSVYWIDRVNGLVGQVEAERVSLAEAYSKSFWPQFKSYVSRASQYDANTLRKRGETQAIAFSFKTLISGTPIVSLRLSTPEGLIVYSTFKPMIGLHEGDVETFQEAVQKGEVISQKVTVPPIAGSTQGSVDAVETFAPLLGTDGRVEGVLVVESNISGPLERLHHQLIRLSIIVVATFFVLFVFLFLIVRRANGIIRDLRTRERQRHAYKLEALSSLAGGMAHEFNNLLLPITSLTDMTLREMPEGSSAQRRLKKVSEASKRAEALIDQFMIYSRYSVSHRENKNLYELVAEMLAALTPTIPENIKLSQNLNPNSGIAFLDAEKIKMVMTNLLSNAQGAIGNQSGDITVCLSVQSIDIPMVLELNDLNVGLYGVISIEDNGCGMDQETLKRVFDPYFTTKEVGDGRGMGLATVAGIVIEHDGTIDITSSPEKGTRVDVYLPLIKTSLPE